MIITHRHPGSNPVLDYTYSYNPAGNAASKNTEHGDYAYNYDPVYRLTSAQRPDATESYEYDGLGNRISSDKADPWVYNANNQLNSFDTTTFGYDNQGNMTSKTVSGTTTTFHYSVDNRLEKVDDQGGTTIASYYYDPFGRRLWKDVAGVRTYFHYNDEGLAGEYNNTGNELRTYGYQPGSPWSTNPLFMQVGGEYYWYQNDHLGTPQKMISGNGTVVWSARYDSFAMAAVAVETVKNNLRFPGQYFNYETGLHYNWHRFYDPETGRYISADPIGLAGGMNLYAYVQGNPINGIDPCGLKCVGPSGSHYVGWSHKLNKNVHNTFTFKISCESGKKLCGTPSINKDKVASKARNSSEVLTRPTSFNILSMTETEVVVEVETRIIVQPDAQVFLLRNIKLCYECCCEQ